METRDSAAPSPTGWLKLVGLGAPPYLWRMRPLPASAIAALLAVTAVPADAQTRPGHGPTAHAPHHPAGGPRRIGRWDDWIAATHQESGQTVCYAFTRAAQSAPSVPGRGDVVLTVTQRPGGRDAVAITAGFALPRDGEVQVATEGATLQFYVSNRSAFARNGRATVAAFERARQASVRFPTPRQSVVTDTFSLRGFSQAYAAISRTCPGR